MQIKDLRLEPFWLDDVFLLNMFEWLFSSLLYMSCYVAYDSAALICALACCRYICHYIPLKCLFAFSLHLSRRRKTRLASSPVMSMTRGKLLIITSDIFLRI